MTLHWKGQRVTARIKSAQKMAINSVMADAVIYAKSNHPYHNITGSAERSVQIAKPAYMTRSGAIGTWGSLDIAYFMRLELGLNGKDRHGTVYHQRAYPSLKPAADIKYPELPARIRAFLS